MNEVSAAERKSVAHLDKRIRAVILSDDLNANERASVRAIYSIITSQAPGKAQSLFMHFKAKVNLRMKEPMRQLHVAYNEVLDEQRAEPSQVLLDDAIKRARKIKPAA